MKSASPQRILLLITVLHGATHLYTTFLAPLNGELKNYFGLTLDQDVTRIMSMYLAFYAFANLMAGLFIAKLSSRTLLAAGPFFNGLCVMGIYLLGPGDYVWLVVLMALGALGGGLYHPVANLLLTKAFPDNKGRALGISGVGACVAFIGGPWAASALVTSGTCDWRTICLVYGCYGVLCGTLAFFLVPSDAAIASHSQSHSGDSLRQPVSGETGAVFYYAAFLILVMATREMASWGTTSITQQFCQEAYTNPIDPGFLVAVIFAPGLIVQPLAGKWSDRFGRELVLAVTMFGMALSLFLIPLAPRGGVVAAYFFLGAMMTATVPTIEALLADRAPLRLRGVVYGMVITAGIGMGALGPKLVGFVADAGHRTVGAYRNAFWTLSGLMLLGFTLALFLKPLARALNVERFGTRATPRQPVGDQVGATG